MTFGLLQYSLPIVITKERLSSAWRTLLPGLRGCLGRWVRPGGMGVPLPAVPRLHSLAWEGGKANDSLSQPLVTPPRHVIP